MKIYQVWGMSLNQKYEERVLKFSFLAQHNFKAELYRYIYIVMFNALSLVNICQNSRSSMHC